MKRKTIGQTSAKLLEYLANTNQNIFDLKVASKITGNSDEATRKLISRLSEKGLVLRIKPGKFYVIPYNENSHDYVPNWHIVARHMVNCKTYIGYYSALEVHSLITQPSLTEQLVVNEALNSYTRKLKEINFQFIYHNPKHFFGFEDTWIDNFNQVKVSNIEKTIIDCLFKPEYAGGITEIAKALYKARNKIDWSKLKKYSKQFDSKAVNKRLGYLLDILELEPKLQKFLEANIGGSHTNLDSTLSKEGDFISRWKLYENVSKDEILSSLST